MTKEFCMTVYSLEPLPQAVRASFKLPVWPFKEGPAGPIPPPTAEYFRSLKIVHYRDELNQFAILCDPQDGREPISVSQNFRGFKSSAVLVFQGMGIKRWDPKGDPVKYRKIVNRHGDDYAWMEWNVERLVLSMDEKVVNTV